MVHFVKEKNDPRGGVGNLALGDKRWEMPKNDARMKLLLSGRRDVDWSGVGF